jgi:OmcA/MtrC family decaheme c-type cytochrome
LKDNDGNPLNISDLDSLTLRLAGPTTDYTFMASEDARSAQATSTGYTYTFRQNGLPPDASGTYAVGAEARDAVTLSGPLLGQSFSATESAFNPIFFFGVGGSAVVPRREVVAADNCNSCHKQLSFHGDLRSNPNYCVMCHNPATVDVPGQAPGGPFNVAPQSINFRFMIHRIHTGEELGRDFTIYRSRGVFNFNEVLFPGDRRNCTKCHVGNSSELPLPDGMAATLAPREFFSPLGPAASACLGCHDSQSAAAHAYLQTAPFGESCAVCHQEGADAAVSRVHAR